MGKHVFFPAPELPPLHSCRKGKLKAHPTLELLTKLGVSLLASDSNFALEVSKGEKTNNNKTTKHLKNGKSLGPTALGLGLKSLGDPQAFWKSSVQTTLVAFPFLGFWTVARGCSVWRTPQGKVGPLTPSCALLSRGVQVCWWIAALKLLIAKKSPQWTGWERSALTAVELPAYTSVSSKAFLLFPPRLFHRLQSQHITLPPLIALFLGLSLQ